MNRIKKLNCLINQSNVDENHLTYIGYLWKERDEKRKARKQKKASRKRNRKSK